MSQEKKLGGLEGLSVLHKMQSFPVLPSVHMNGSSTSEFLSRVLPSEVWDLTQDLFACKVCMLPLSPLNRNKRELLWIFSHQYIEVSEPAQCFLMLKTMPNTAALLSDVPASAPFSIHEIEGVSSTESDHWTT